jgi:hypothetical protein
MKMMIRPRFISNYTFKKYLGHKSTDVTRQFPTVVREISTKKISRHFTVPLDDDKKRQAVFLHIAPCGDFWTGHEVFAAKHLQPDYVKSIPIPFDIQSDVETFLNDYEGDLDVLLRKVYDEQDISLIIDQIREWTCNEK